MKKSLLLILKFTFLLFLPGAHALEVKPLQNFSDDEFRQWLSPPSEVNRATTRSSRNAAIRPKALEFTIQFEFDSDRIDQNDIHHLKRLASAMVAENNRGYFFLVEGHTDRKGSYAYNVDLSLRRATSVLKALSGFGVEHSRLQASGKGYTQLINEDEPFAAENRRVRILANPGRP